MTRKRTAIITILFVLIFAMIVYFLETLITRKYPLHPTMFQSIEELDILSSYVIEDVADRNIAGMNYSDKIQWEIQIDNRSYTIFGYVFLSAEDASRYLEAVYDNTYADDRGYTIYSKAWISKTEYVSQYDCNILCIKGKNYRDVVELLDLLGKTFSLQLRDF